MASHTAHTGETVPQSNSNSTANSANQDKGLALSADGPSGNGSSSRKEKPGSRPRQTVTVKRQSRWKPLVIILSNIFAVTALIVSYLSVSEQRRGTEEQRKLNYNNATQQIIHDQYELCRELDQLRVEHPEVSHMLMLPAADDPNDPWKNYRSFKWHVRSLLSTRKGTVTAAEQSKLLLQEHAVALNVFDIYEQTIYQWQAAEEVNDTDRAATLKMLVDYYEGRMLRNPRLRYHWKHGGSDMVEKNPTRDRYAKYVELGNTEQPVPYDFVDETSPLDSLPATSP